MRKIAAYIERDIETGFYVGIIPGISGAHTQGETLDELHKNLKEVVALCVKEMTSEQIDALPEFVGIQQVEVPKCSNSK
ncbi:MAG: type II toxin-antitoxin system HicB family antitoxin [bacterium]|nr:type II toxin-antitoxin system HicB family antitoxin [bacterium]